MKNLAWIMAVSAVLLPVAGRAQGEFSAPKPSVQVVRISAAPLEKGKGAPIHLDFRVAQGFHINSNHPNSQLLIPTVLRLDPPTDLTLGNITYPAGQDLAFAFSPDEKLSVYSGDCSVRATARTIGSLRPRAYRVHGELHYQACDNSACYPPKSLPVAFDVRVERPAAKVRRNPAQSPNVHK